MADISKITLPTGTTYNLKDAVARDSKVDNDIFVAENLIKYPYAQMFESRLSVQFTYDDGVITLNGISNDGSTDTVATMNLYTHFTLKDGQYTLSANSSSSKIGVRFYGHDADGNTSTLKTVYGSNSFVYDTTNDGYNEYSLNLRVLNNYNGTEFVNDTCKPMFEIGNVAHAYQPYKLSRRSIRNDISIIFAENLIPFPFYFTDGYEYKGITYNSTVDGGVTITGTATGTTYVRLNKENLIMLEHKRYIVSGCPDGGSDTTYCIGVTKGSTSNIAAIKDYGNGAVIDNTDGSFDEGINITVAVYGGTYNNFEFKPMLEVGDTAHEFQPYKLSRKAMRDDIDTLMALLTNGG